MEVRTFLISSSADLTSCMDSAKLHRAQLERPSGIPPTRPIALFPDSSAVALLLHAGTPERGDPSSDLPASKTTLYTIRTIHAGGLLSVGACGHQ